jgi:hypothetical protein
MSSCPPPMHAPGSPAPRRRAARSDRGQSTAQVITGIAAMISAIGGTIGVLYQVGVIGHHSGSAPGATPPASGATASPSPSSSPSGSASPGASPTPTEQPSSSPSPSASPTPTPEAAPSGGGGIHLP